MGNGMLVVKGEMTDCFEVKLELNRRDFIVDVHLIPNEETKNNGVEQVYLDVDILNETVPQVLKRNGYKIVDSKHF